MTLKTSNRVVLLGAVALATALWFGPEVTAEQGGEHTVPQTAEQIDAQQAPPAGQAPLAHSCFMLRL